MKKYILLWTCLLLYFTESPAQNHPSPYQLKTEFTGDFVSNFDGGKETGHSYIGKIDLSLAFYTEKAGWQKGGKLFIRAINAHGGNPSARYIGDIQPVSRIEAYNRTSLFEFWYSQNFGRLSLLAGQFDMNSAFGVNASASHLINTSFGMYPSVALNVPLSIYPAASAAVYANWSHSKKIAIRAAVFDGAPLTFELNPNNIKWKIRPDKGLFSTMEFEYRAIRENVVYGTYKLGGYVHNGEFRSLADSSRLIRKSYGIYFTLDRRLYRKNTADHQGLDVFVQSGTSPGAGNLVDFYLSSGLVYTGIFKGRSRDVLALGMVYSSVNDRLYEANPLAYTDSRSLLELNYKLKLGENFTLQPDLQYIIHPGARPDLKNACLGTLRVAIHY